MEDIRKVSAFAISGSYLKKSLELHFNILPCDYTIPELFDEDHFTSHILFSLKDIYYISSEDITGLDERDKIASLICTIIKDTIPEYADYIIIEVDK